ncbi:MULTISPECIES: dimethylargininase [Microbacterium]|uniref:dimethylargininase n=1 Tax=Microbacterium TaxID=33882 RepID=UPI0030D9B67C
MSTQNTAPAPASTSTATEENGSATGPGRIQQVRRYLMCRPEHFTVSYTINPWMEPANPTDTALAVRQWQALYDTYLALGHEVHLIDPIEGLPDMVYTANGGFVIDNIAYGAKFRFQERVPEGPAFMDWFRANGFEVAEPAEVNEGEGDFLLVGDTILAGTGFRSTGDSHRELADVFGKEVVSLTLVDPRFYHLDTAISVLDPVQGPGGVEKANIAYLEHAFDERSQAILAERYPDAIRVADADGAVFGLNSSSDGLNVIISPRAKGFEAQLRERGYNPVLVDLSELLLGGGGIKCCTLELRR